jgi:hypothetical protein
MVSPANNVPSWEIPMPRRSTDPTALTDPMTGFADEKSAAEIGIVTRVVVNNRATARSFLKSQLNVNGSSVGNKLQEFSQYAWICKQFPTTNVQTASG